MAALSLSSFQYSFRKRLVRELGELGFPLRNEETGGRKELYVTGEIGDTGLKIWIYKDSAEFTDLDRIDSRFESVDYDSLEELSTEYLEELRKVLQTVAP